MRLLRSLATLSPKTPPNTEGLTLGTARRALGVVGLLPLISMLLTGCLKLDADLEVSSSDLVSGQFSAGLAVAVAGTEQVPSEIELYRYFEPADGVTLDTFVDEEFIGEVVTFENVPFGYFGEQADGEPLLTFERDGDLIRIGGVINLNNLSGIENYGGRQENVSITIKVPGEVIASNGIVSADGRTIEWSPLFGTTTALEATIDAPPDSGLSLQLTILLSILIVAGAAAVFVARSRRDKPEVNKSEIGPATPREPSESEDDSPEGTR